MSEMRLQRWLAACGVASRRHCEELIAAGRVEVNGRTVTEPGTKVEPERDEVRVDGERVRAPRRLWYVALNKPPGVVCTTEDPAGRPRAIDLVGAVPARLFPVGRLDEDSEGLLLLTNDGAFAERVAHPRYEVPKIYRVTVKGEPDPGALAKLQEGVWLSEGKTLPARVKTLRKTREFTTLLISLREGKNREVRRMLAKVALPVTKLLRVQVGPVRLGTLKRGEWRHLEREEIEGLLRERPRGGGERPQGGGAPHRRASARPGARPGQRPGTKPGARPGPRPEPKPGARGGVNDRRRSRPAETRSRRRPGPRP